MSAKPERHLQPVDTETGEIGKEAPSYSEALRALGELERQIALMDNDLKGKRLAIDNLKRDREQDAINSPEAPVVEMLHAAWTAGTNRRRPLHFTDREQITAALKALGLDQCVRAIAGASYDANYSSPRRNGHRERYDDLDLIFRTYAKVKQFAARVPNGYQPDPDKLAELSGVPAKRIREWLETYDGKRHASAR